MVLLPLSSPRAAHAAALALAPAALLLFLTLLLLLLLLLVRRLGLMLPPPPAPLLSPRLLRSGPPAGTDVRSLHVPQRQLGVQLSDLGLHLTQLAAAVGLRRLHLRLQRWQPRNR